MNCVFRLTTLAVFTLGALSAFGQSAWAQQKADPTTAEAKAPDYPRVNLAPWYEVDPKWPQKPPQVEWAAMPGIAVDREDRVWIFTRAKPPIQVYDADGRFIRAWGSATIGSAHHIEIDHEGNVWLADIGLHVVRKFSPGGEVLLTLGTPGEAGEDRSGLPDMSSAQRRKELQTLPRDPAGGLRA